MLFSVVNSCLFEDGLSLNDVDAVMCESTHMVYSHLMCIFADKVYIICDSRKFLRNENT